MLNNINLKRELEKQHVSPESKEADSLMDQAFNVLLDDVCAEREIQEALESGSKEVLDLNMLNLDQDNVYSLSEIRKLCIRFRLRFLDVEKFNPGIPYDAVSKIRQFEREIGGKVRKFKIMAPSEMFELEDCDKDPVLFADLGNGKYHYIHHWGSDLLWWRPLLLFPLRNFKTLALSILTISIALSLLIPSDLIVDQAMVHEGWARFAFFAWSFVCITAMVTYIGFAFFKNLSSAQWNSPFFKQTF